MAGKWSSFDEYGNRADQKASPVAAPGGLDGDADLRTFRLSVDPNTGLPDFGPGLYFNR